MPPAPVTWSSREVVGPTAWRRRRPSARGPGVWMRAIGSGWNSCLDPGLNEPTASTTTWALPAELKIEIWPPGGDPDGDGVRHGLAGVVGAGGVDDDVGGAGRVEDRDPPAAAGLDGHGIGHGLACGPVQAGSRRPGLPGQPDRQVAAGGGARDGDVEDDGASAVGDTTDPRPPSRPGFALRSMARRTGRPVDRPGGCRGSGWGRRMDATPAVTGTTGPGGRRPAPGRRRWWR